MRRWWPRSSALLVAALVGVASAGCTGADTPDPGTSPSAPSVSPSPSAAASTPAGPSTTVDPATEKAVLAAYRGYWAERVKAQGAPSQGVPEALDTYAVDKAAADVVSSVALFAAQGIEVRGEPVLSPTVTSVTDGDPAMASITDCVDSTDWRPVFAATGESALAPGQPTRVVVESTASTYAGRWVIRTSTAFRDRTC